MSVALSVGLLGKRDTCLYGRSETLPKFWKSY